MSSSINREFSYGRLRIRVNWMIAVCVCVAVALFINLGLWQLGRAAEKRQLQRAVQARQAEAPVPLTSLAAATDQALLQNRRVSAGGEYLNERSFLLVYQFLQGQPGFEVFTPFRLADDAQLVLVSRGWAPPGPGSDGQPMLPEPAAESGISGLLHFPEQVDAGQFDAGVWPVRMRRLDLSLMQELLGEPLQAYIIRLDPGAPGVLARHWPAETASVRSNIAYALQWFSFAALTLLISLLLSSNLWQLLQSRTASSRQSPE
jgi:surfeit locus 1 family protein